MAYVFSRVSCGLLQEVDEVRGTEFAKGDEGLGTSIDGLLKDLFGDSRRWHDISVTRQLEGKRMVYTLWNSGRNHDDGFLHLRRKLKWIRPELWDSRPFSTRGTGRG